MENFSKEDRGIFQGIKVPFCLNAIILAFMAYVIFIAGADLLGWVMKDNIAYEKVVYSATNTIVKKLPVLERPINEVVLKYSYASRDNLMEAWYNYHRHSNENVEMEFEEFIAPEWWKSLVFAVWFLLIWSFFAGAINRTAAYRIARDESITLREGLNFGAQTWANHFLAILFLAIFIASAFFICVLASLVLDQIPYVGELVLIIAFIFILVAAFLITLLLAGLLFGFNMISSAIGVDRVDSFDAISRSYSYVLGRPWQTLLYTALPLLFVTFFLYFGRVFQEVAIQSVALGMGEDFEPIRRCATLGASWGDLGDLVWTQKLAAFVIKIFIWFAHLFVVSTAIAYWLSARTKAYLLLRKEVDGDEVEEMYLDEEEEALDAVPEPAPVVPAPVAEKKKEAAPKPKKEKKAYSEADLSGLHMDELRAIGEKFSVSGRSKKKIIERILKAQKEK